MYVLETPSLIENILSHFTTSFAPYRKHQFWCSVIWELMIKLYEPFLNRSYWMLNFRDIILICCVIHFDINVFEFILNWFKLRIHIYPLDLESWLIVYSEFIVECFIKYRNLTLCDILNSNELNCLGYGNEKHRTLDINDIGKSSIFWCV